MLWLQGFVDKDRVDIVDSIHARRIVLENRPSSRENLQHHFYTEADDELDDFSGESGKQEHHISFCIGDDVYFVDGETTHVFRVGHYKPKGNRLFVVDQISFLGLLPEALRIVSAAQQAKFLSDTTPENTRRPEKLEMIAAFRKVHDVNDQTFNGIDVNQCWIFQNKLKEIAKILNISLEEEPTPDRPAP